MPLLLGVPVAILVGGLLCTVVAAKRLRAEIATASSSLEALRLAVARPARHLQAEADVTRQAMLDLRGRWRAGGRSGRSGR